MATVASAEILLKLNTREYDQKLKQVGGEFESFSRKSFGVQVNNRDADLALQTTLGIANQLGGALKSIGSQAVNEFRAFSSALAGTAAISGASGEEIEALKEEAIALGIATTKSPTQVAQAATAYTRLGFSATQATKDLGGLVQLSESTGSSLESSAQVTATATKIFGDSVSAVEAANIITAATTNTAVSSVDEFNQVLSKAAGLAKSNGVSFEELASTFGLLRTTGSSAEVAATAVKNSLLQLTTPTAAGKEAIARLGLQVRDESGKFIGLRNVLEQLRSSLAGVDDATRDQSLKDIFGRFAGPAITSLLALDPSEFNRVFDQIASSSEGAGVAAETADKRLQGLDRTLTLLEGTTQTTKAAVGESLAPAFNLAANAALKSLNFFLELPEPIQKVAVGLGAATAGAASLTVALSALRSAQAANTFATLGLSASALKETLMSTGEAVGGVSRNIAGALGNVNVELPTLPAVSAKGGEARQRLAIAKEAAAAQALSINERTAKELEFFAFKKDLASKEAALSARRIAAEQGGSAVASKRAAAEALKAQAIANSAKADAVAARAAATKSAADLKAATSAKIAATAEVKQALSTKASSVASSVNAAATKAAAFAKQTLAVATGKASAAQASSAVATAAAGVQLALFAAAAFTTIEALKTIGILGNESAASLRRFKKELKEIEDQGSPSFDVEEEDLGFIDKVRVGFDQALNIFRETDKTTKESANSVTSLAQAEAQRLQASAGLRDELVDIILEEGSAITARKKALEEDGKIESLSLNQKSARIALIEDEISKTEKQINAAKDSGLEASGQIRILEEQNAQRKATIDLLKGETPARREQIIATELQTKSLKDLQAAQTEADAAAELALANARASATEQFAAGDISESEQQKIISEAEKTALEERLKNNRIFLSELKALQTDDVTDEQSAKIQGDIVKAEQEQAKLRLDIAKNQIEEEKRLSEERLQVLEDADSERVAQAETTALEIEKIILQEQLAGLANAEQTQQRLTQAELQGIQERLSNRKKALSELQNAEGLDPEDQAEAEKKAQQDILNLEIELAQKRIAIREQEKERQIKAIEESQAAAQKASQQGLKEEELLLKQSLAERSITREQFESESKALQVAGTEERIKLLQQEADAVRALATEGILPQEEAQKRLGDIQSQITDQQLKLVDAQIDAQKQLAEETEARLEREIEARRITAQLAEQDLDFQKQAIAFQSELAAAQQGLGEAQSALLIQRLGFAKEDAATQQEAFEISKQIFEAEKAATLAKLDNEKRVLEIKIQQQQLDNQIASSQANIAVIEAKAAIEAAKARNASSEELANLEKVLQLKTNILGQTEASASSQAELFNIQRDTLAVNEELTKEQLARDEQLLQRSSLGIERLSPEEQRQARLDKDESDKIIGDLSAATFTDGGDQAGAIAQAALANLDNDILLDDLSGVGGVAGQIADLVSQLPEDEFGSRELREFDRTIEGAESSFEVIELLRQLVEINKESPRQVNINNNGDDFGLEILRGVTV